MVPLLVRLGVCLYSDFADQVLALVILLRRAFIAWERRRSVGYLVLFMFFVHSHLLRELFEEILKHMRIDLASCISVHNA